MTLTLKCLIKRTLFITAALILAVNAGLLLYYNFYFNKDVLIKYFPTDTIFYVNGSPTPKIFANESVAQIMDESGLQNFYKDSNKLLNGLTENAVSFGLIPITYPEGTKLEPILVFDLRGKLEVQELVTVFHEKHGLLSRQLNNNFLQRNVVIFGLSQTALDRVGHVVAQRIESLADNTEIVGKLQAYNHPYSARGVLLAKKLSRLENLETQPALFGAIIRDFGFDELYFGARVLDSGKIVIESEKEGSSKHAEPLFSLIPQNTTTYLSTTNPLEAITRFFSLLKEADEALHSELLGVQSFIEGSYAIDLESDISPLLKNQFEIVASENGVMAAFPVQGEQKELESLIQKILLEYLAISYPLEQEFTLKDGSTGKEIRKNYVDITENTTNVSTIPLYTVSLSSGEEMGMFVRENTVFVSNSLEMLENNIEYTNVSDISTIFPCEGVEGGELAMIDGSFLSRYNDFWSNINSIGFVYTGGRDRSIHMCL